MKDEFTIAGRAFDAETKEVVAIPVTTDLGGGEINLYVHMVTGAEPGPTLALLSTVHGSEFLPNAVMRQFVASLNPADIRGRLLIVPVGNPVAYQTLSRNTRDESDTPDLNRVFPGEHTFITEQIARIITNNVLKKTDYLLDFHYGHWAAAMGMVNYGVDFEPDVAQKSREIAFAFGWPSVHGGSVATHFPGPRSSTGYTGRILGKPCITVEIGGAGFGGAEESTWVATALTGIRNVMVYLGMMEGTLDLPERYLEWRKRWRVNPSIGGCLLPEVPWNSLMREVKQGEVLAKVVSPYTFEVLEELRSPGQGVITYTAREYPVRPGDWAYGVIDLNDSHTNWVQNPLR